MADSETGCEPQNEGMPMNTEDLPEDPSQDDVDDLGQKQDEFVSSIGQRSKPFVDGISNLTRQSATITLRTAIMVHPQLLHQLDKTETKGNQMDSLVVLGQEKKNELTKLTDDGVDVEQLLKELDDLVLNDESDDDDVI